MARGSKGGGKTPTTPSAAARVESAYARSGRDCGKGSFPARLKSAAANNAKPK